MTLKNLTLRFRPASALAATLTAATLVAAPIAAQAQAMPKTGAWQTNLTLYAWLPGFSGETNFPAESGGSGINVNADAILENLKMVFMGTLDVHNGRWGLFNDLIYMNVGDDKSNTREFGLGGGSLPANVTADLDFDLKAWVWTVAGEYRVIASPTLTMDVLGGVRMLDLSERLTYSLYGDISGTGISGRNGSRSADQTNWDGVIGVKGRYTFGAQREWFVPYYLDVGAGDSDLTWQGVVGLGYQFNWGAATVLYRYLDYSFKSGGAVKDLTAAGPQFGVTFTF